MPKPITGVERATDDRPLLEPRLWGTWKSDRRKTFERMRLSGPPASQRKFRSLYGKLTMTWKRSTMSSCFSGNWMLSRLPMDPTPTHYHYRVIARSSEDVVLALWEDPTRREKADGAPQFESLVSINFDETGFWLYVNSGWSEYFRKVDPATKPVRRSK